MPARRIMLLVSALLLITIALSGVLPREPPSSPQDRASADQPSASAVQLVRRSLDARAKRPRTVSVPVGTHLRLTVDGAEAPDVVELVGLDRLAQTAPATPAVFDVLADAPGTYQVTLVSSGRRIGALRVTRAPQ